MARTTESNSYELSVDQQTALIKLAVHLRGQKPTKVLSKKDLLRTHSKNLSLLKESAVSGLPTQLILPNAYTPSITSLSELKKTSISDLMIDTHHRGYFITGKTITPPYQSTGLITIVQEEGGEVWKLSLYYQDDSVKDTVLPVNSIVAIKEPYYTFNGDGDYIIRVDHPSDIAILRGDDPAVSMIMQLVLEKREMTPVEWKAAGDKAYMEKNYFSAIECYTQSIDKASQDDKAFVRDVYRKRAYCNLIAKRYDVAKEDALASCSGESASDERGCFFAGRAAYELGYYAESKGHFERALKFSPSNPKYKQEHTLAAARIIEQEDGEYDFKAMLSSLTDDRIHLDHADFISNTIIGDTAEHGRGLFATRDIKAGDLVLCEKALCLPNIYGDHPNKCVLYNVNNQTKTHRAAQPALFIELVKKLSNNPLLTSKFFDLDSGTYIRSGMEGEIVDSVPIIDVFLIEAIRLRNCFSAPRRPYNVRGEHFKSDADDLSTGLWTRAAYINHSCVPNCARAFIGDMQILRATCDIPEGSEITHQYKSPEANYKTRQELYQESWAFECDCRLCGGEKQSPESMHQRRQELIDKITKEVLKKNPSSFVPEATVRKVERLTDKLEELHEPEVYRNLPRLLLIRPTIWLAEFHHANQNHRKALKYALEVLRNFGFVNPIRDGKLRLDDSGGIINSESLNAIRYASEAYKALDDLELSRQCEEAARLAFVMRTGSAEGVDELWACIE